MLILHCFRQAAHPYGASTVSGLENNLPTADDLEVARFQGKRVAQVARALKIQNGR
jgi:NAD(P)H dehydrogenase (quinone)